MTILSENESKAKQNKNQTNDETCAKTGKTLIGVKVSVHNW